MNIAVCDDINEVLDDTKKVLERIPYIKSIGLFSNIEFLFEDIKEGNQYDVILMDIDWKMDKTGIDFAVELQKCSPYTKIIYVTAYTIDYVEDIFLKSSNLSGFLMKPVKQEILEKNLEKILRAREAESGKLMIKYNGKVQMIPFYQILYLESNLRKLVINSFENSWECFEKLNEVEKRLNNQFVRCHQSYIVNMNYIREFQSKEILLEDGNKIPVSKKRYADAKKCFFEYMTGRM